MRRAPGAPCPSASSYLLCLGPGRARDTAEVAPDEEARRCARGLLRSTLLMLRGAAASTMLPDVPIHPGRKHVIQRNSRSTYHQESDFLQILESPPLSIVSTCEWMSANKQTQTGINTCENIDEIMKSAL